MQIIGEKINSSIPSSLQAIEQKDVQAVAALAKAQYEAGASFIDINAGTFLEREAEYLSFLAKTVGEGLKLPLSIDTPSAKSAEAALKAAGNGEYLLNSATLEPERLDGMSALAGEYGCGVVALCMQETASEDSVESRLKTAGRLVEALTGKGIAPGKIYIDPMLSPLGAQEGSGVLALESLRRLHKEFPECHLSIGLSNLSFGLPKRRLINRAFAVAAIGAGLDTAIADPLDKDLMGLIAAAETIMGLDEYCLEYIGKCREGLI